MRLDSRYLRHAESGVESTRHLPAHPDRASIVIASAGSPRRSSSLSVIARSAATKQSSSAARACEQPSTIAPNPLPLGAPPRYHIADRGDFAPMTNTLHYGDNLHVLREHIASESVDLIYLDPPFNSNANYNRPPRTITFFG